MESNPYQAPESNVTPVSEDINVDLASRWSRLGASIVDTIVMMVIIFPLMFAFGLFETFTQGQEPPFIYTLGMGLVSIVAFFVINIKFLKDNGQTIGKKVLGIKIVDMAGVKPPVGNHILKRYLAYFTPNYIPVIGGFLSMINVLFVFRKDKRCIHDLIAGTQVVRA